MITLFLLTINSYARIKVDITNSDSQQMYAEFDTQAEADAYILKFAEKNQWGQSVWLQVDCGNSFTSRNDMGTLEYLCPQDFTVTTSDITAEYTERMEMVELTQDIGFGKGLYIKITKMIKDKSGMDKATRRAVRASFKDIVEDLKAGSVCDAREDIAVITPTAVITAQDIADVLAMIDAYKTCP